MAVGLLQLLRPPGAGAEAGAGGFRLLARADVASVAVVYPDAPAVPEGEVAYFSPGTTQAVIDSLGSSEAIASAPYPGDSVANLPPTLNGVLGGKAPSLPDYPFIAASSHPTRPEAAQQIGPYRIEAASDALGSSAAGHLGVSAGETVLGRVEPSSQVGRRDGTGTAVARNRVSGITAGSVLEIGEVEAVASIRSTGTATPERTSSLRIEGMKVAGVAVTLTEKGLSAGQTVVTAPGTADVDKVLEQAGVSVRYLPASTSDSSVTSAALAITSKAAIPGRSPVTVTVTLGAVRVSSTTLPVELPAIGTGDVFSPLPEPGSQGAVTAGDDVLAVGPSPSIPTGTAELPVPSGAVTSPAPDGTPPAAETTLSETAGPRRATRVRAGQQADGRGFYLALVATGGALLVGSRLLGALAVQLRRLPRPVRRT